MAENETKRIASDDVSRSESTEDRPPQNYGSGRHTHLSDKELEHFRQLIMKRRDNAAEDIDRMREQIRDSREQGSEDSAYSFHMADAGTDAMEREKLYLMVARQQKYVGYLDRALDRIENRTYGICKVTGKPISQERLEAVPHTEISIPAKKKQRANISQIREAEEMHPHHPIDAGEATEPVAALEAAIMNLKDSMLEGSSSGAQRHPPADATPSNQAASRAWNQVIEILSDLDERMDAANKRLKTRLDETEHLFQIAEH